MQDTNKLDILDIDMSIIADYISNKYVITAYTDMEDTLYIQLSTGRIVITYEELLEFLDNNQEHYIRSGWTWTDLIDIYIMYCFISALNNLTDSLYQNNNSILQ